MLKSLKQFRTLRIKSALIKSIAYKKILKLVPKNVYIYIYTNSGTNLRIFCLKV